MPGARLASFRHGDNAERLAEFILSSFAFTTSVPRQEDVGHDFHCVLTIRDPDKQMLRAGPSFSVQVKSNLDKVTYSKEHEIDWIVNQENPFFLCVSDRAKLRCDIYSTWNRLNGIMYYGRQVTSLIPEEFGFPALVDDVLRIPLGPPVLRLTAKEAVSGGHNTAEAVMRWWIELDRTNIVNNHSGVYVAEGPSSWSTNQVPSEIDVKQHYWNSKNIQQCIDNFGRTALALRNTVERLDYEGDDLGHGQHLRRLEQAFDGFKASMDPWIVSQFATTRRFHRRSTP